MLCQNCQKKPAEYHYQSNINGNRTESHLCRECAERLGKKDPFGGSYLSSLLSDFMSPFVPLHESSRCPLCGATAQDIQRSGKAGCAQCYETFGRLLNPYIRRIHGSTKHNGKLPESAGAVLRQQRTIEQTKEELRKAVEAQEFERAAELRDQLKALQA